MLDRELENRYRDLENSRSIFEFQFYWYGQIAGIRNSVPLVVAMLDDDKNGKKLFIVSSLKEGDISPCGGKVIKNKIFQGSRFKDDYMIFKIIYPNLKS